MQLLPHLAGTATTPNPSPGGRGPADKSLLRNPLQAAKEKYRMMVNQAKVPEQDQFYDMMNTVVQPGALVFWSMLGKGPNGESLSSQVEAQTYAATYHKQLLRPLMQQVDPEYPDGMIFNKFKGITAPQRNELVDLTWSRTSRAFAKHVKGRAVVVLKGPATDGTKWPSNDDCWAKDEYPVLTAPGGACTEIVRIEANDWVRPLNIGGHPRKGLLIWKRGEGVLNPPVDLDLVKEA